MKQFRDHQLKFHFKTINYARSSHVYTTSLNAMINVS